MPCTFGMNPIMYRCTQTNEQTTKKLLLDNTYKQLSTREQHCFTRCTPRTTLTIHIHDHHHHLTASVLFLQRGTLTRKSRQRICTTTTFSFGTTQLVATSFLGVFRWFGGFFLRRFFFGMLAFACVGRLFFGNLTWFVGL